MHYEIRSPWASALLIAVSEKREVLLFDPETDDIIRSLDVKKVIHPSPSQGSSISHLFAQELEESNSPLSDVFNVLSAQKNSIIYDSKQKFDFTAGILNHPSSNSWA